MLTLSQVRVLADVAHWAGVIAEGECLGERESFVDARREMLASSRASARVLGLPVEQVDAIQSEARTEALITFASWRRGPESTEAGDQ